MSEYIRYRDNEYIATTTQIIKHWLAGGLENVHTFLNNENVKVYEDTWGYKLKKLLENKNNYASVNEEINFTYLSINRNNIKK